MTVPAIYCRVSSRTQEDGFSLETQEASCRAKLRELGYNDRDSLVYREIHTGSEFFERPMLMELFREVEEGHISVVVCHAIDRLSREQHHQGHLITTFEKYNVAYAFATEDFDNSPQGRALRGMMGFVAEMERLKILERTVRGRNERVRKGLPLAGAHPPYGYQWVDGDRPKERLEIDPKTERTVREIFDRLSQGVSAHQVMLWLNKEGVPTPQNAGQWSTRAVLVIARNPVYMGQYVVRRNSDEEVMLPDIAPAYVSEQTMMAIEGHVSKNKSRAIRNNRDPEATLLRGGYARCGYCGGVMGVHYSKAGKGYQYRCHQATRGHMDCKAPTMMAHKLDPQVWKRVSDALQNPDLLRRELERKRSENTLDRDIQSLLHTMAEAERRRKNLASRLALIDDDEAAAPVVAELNRLAKEVRALQQDLDRLQDEHTLWEQSMGRLDDLEEWSETLAENIDNLTYEQKRLALHAFDVQVLVYSQGDSRKSKIRLNLDIVEPTTSPACRDRTAGRRCPNRG